MGEGFLGFPNGFRVCGTEPPDENSYRTVKDCLETENNYTPNHVLSAYYGYRLSSEYLSLKGGARFQMKGDFFTQNVRPVTTQDYSIGAPESKYTDVYATNFKGTADSARKLSNKVHISVTGAVTGDVKFDGSEATVTLNTVLNHSHDGKYLKLSGGLMTGSIKFSPGTGVLNANGVGLLTHYGDKLYIGAGLYNSKRGCLQLYSHESAWLTTRDSVFIELYKNTTKSSILCISDTNGTIKLTNVSTGCGICITEDGQLQRISRTNNVINNYTLYDTGNYTPPSSGGSSPSQPTINPSDYISASASCNKNWNWAAGPNVGLPAQPSWVWGGNDGQNMYVWNPATFSVNYANSAGSANSAATAVTSTNATYLLGRQSLYRVGVSADGTCLRVWHGLEDKIMDGQMNLGSPHGRWGTIYSANGLASSSDKNAKKNIRPLYDRFNNDKYMRFFLLLQPKSFLYKNDKSNKTYIGFVAQDVENALRECGMDNDDFAGLVKDIRMEYRTDENGNEVEVPVLDEDGNPTYIYSLLYEQFIGILTMAIQKLFEDFRAVKKNFQEQLNQLYSVVQRRTGLIE